MGNCAPGTNTQSLVVNSNPNTVNNFSSTSTATATTTATTTRNSITALRDISTPDTVFSSSTVHHHNHNHSPHYQTSQETSQDHSQQVQYYQDHKQMKLQLQQQQDQQREWSLIQSAQKRCRKGDQALKIGNYDSALDHYKMMLHVPQFLPNSPRAALYIQQIAMGSMAKVYMYENNTNDALRLYQSALDIATSDLIQDRRGEAIIRMKMGILYRDQLKQYRKAMVECQLAVDIFHELGQEQDDPSSCKVDEAIALQNLGNVLQKRRHLDASKDCYRRARAILRAHDDHQQLEFQQQRQQFESRESESHGNGNIIV